MDTGLVAAEIGEPLEIGNDALSVNPRHVLTPFLRLVEVGERLA
jgi:hypothetical protein